MSFSGMMELLQRKDKGFIILVNLGSFYIARGKDAVLLHNIFDLKVNCLEAEICKVGFPLNSLEKYTKLIEKEKYSYIVYNFDSKTSNINVLKRFEGEKLNELKEERLNCYICANTVKIYKKPDKYIEAVAKLYECEQKEDNNKEQKNINMVGIQFFIYQNRK